MGGKLTAFVCGFSRFQLHVKVLYALNNAISEGSTLARFGTSNVMPTPASDRVKTDSNHGPCAIIHSHDGVKSASPYFAPSTKLTNGENPNSTSIVVIVSPGSTMTKWASSLRSK